MNEQAEQHLTKAKDCIARGDQFYREAKVEIDAAIAAGASQREVARFLARSHTWVQNVLAWDGTGTLYGNDTERRQIDMAKQVLNESPDAVLDKLSDETLEQVAAKAGDKSRERRIYPDTGRPDWGTVQQRSAAASAERKKEDPHLALMHFGAGLSRARAVIHSIVADYQEFKALAEDDDELLEQGRLTLTDFRASTDIALGKALEGSWDEAFKGLVESTQ